MITREPDPSDGRGSLVTLTKAGVRAVDAAMEELLGRERNFLAPLSSEEKKELARLLSLIAAQFEDEI